MKSGEKMTFTPAQREAMLHLYTQMVLILDAEDRVSERASIACRTMWNTIYDTLGLDKTWNYRLLPGFQGVQAYQNDSILNIDKDTFEILKEWIDIRDKLMKHPVNPDETVDDDTSS